MIVFPNAKINLGLNVTSKREDGYHNLESVFYPIEWKDILEIIESKELVFESSGISIPGNPKDNLCLKAYELVKKDFHISPVHIHLHKVIPIGAGLGGGSADAAFTLKLLNQLFELNISTNQLVEYARNLGSDCAFFIENVPVFAMGKGDEFEPVKINLEDKKIILVNPNIHISTSEAYAGILPQVPDVSIRDLIQQPIATWKASIKNDFESALARNFPQIEEIKQELYNQGAIYAAMTGSGSTVYGIFDSKPILTFPKDYYIWTKLEN